MARKKIREYDSKRLLKAHILRLKGIKLPLNVAQVLPRSDKCWNEYTGKVDWFLFSLMQNWNLATPI